AVWSRASIFFSGWEVDMQMRVTRLGHQGAQGMLRLLVTSHGDSPAIHVPASEEHISLSCFRKDLSLPNSCAAYTLPTWASLPEAWIWSVYVGPLPFAPGSFFGISAATRTLADDHGVLSFLTFSLSQPGPEAPLKPFLEIKQLRLVRQLEGQRARLVPGTREDMIPKLGSKEGRGPGSRQDAATHMASRAQVFYPPVSIKHPFLELAHLSLLQKNLWGPAVRGTEAAPWGFHP
ncbi:LOW QUALITY PROTEIN: protein ERGIC-53-like, partial [Glossophaga mutica]